MTIWHKFPKDRLLVEASLWSADFTHFAKDISRMENYIDMFHIDVSDGSFVPGLLFFADLVKALRPLTKRLFHVHLMTVDPLKHIPDFIAAGANIITIQAENGPLIPAALELAKSNNVSTGIAVSLETLPENLEPYLELTDIILMMGTPLGVKGVQLSQFAYKRIERVRSLIHATGLEDQVKIFADGGIRQHTVPLLRSAGADGIIAGSLIFNAVDVGEMVSWLHGLPMEMSKVK